MSDETQDFSDESWDGNDADDESGADDAAAAGSDPVSSENGGSQADGAPGGEADGDRRRRRRRPRDEDNLESFDERARRAQAFVDDVVRKMGMDCRVRLRRPREGDSVDEINLEILRHILVDAEGYRSRRDMSLANMARRLGKQAVDEGKIITFEPMNPRDRRVVHLALAKFEGVITKSDGEGEQRTCGPGAPGRCPAGGGRRATVCCGSAAGRVA